MLLHISRHSSSVMDYHPSVEFPGKTFHTFTLFATLRLENLLKEHATQLVHSEVTARGHVRASADIHATLRLQDDLFMEVQKQGHEDLTRLTVWGTDFNAIRVTANSWTELYKREDVPAESFSFCMVLPTDSLDFAAREVEGTRPFVARGEGLRLHYGAGCEHWTETLVTKLHGRPDGMVILNGPPGTGKTSFIRHLMHRLKASHIFYCIQVNQIKRISNTLMRFLINEKCERRPRKLVLVLEDAEALLAMRDASTADQVSTLLNATDGFVAEAASLQVICTVNSPLHKLDPAVIRPGRLVASWEFRRLGKSDAMGLAAHLGRDLPPQDDYSLAEIYAGHAAPTHLETPRCIGFQAATEPKAA